jgi:SPX domain protein involved in polyphosphate accumulation
LEIDEFGATQPNFSYPIHSLYLDSELLTFYWHTINGDKNRFKLRLRFYEGGPSSPVYFEIKRRSNDAILKQRGAVRRECVAWLLAGHLPSPSHLISVGPKDLVALRGLPAHERASGAAKAHVAYLREAWISPHNNAVRVTMDRNVRCEPDETTRLSTEMNNQWSCSEKMSSWS